MTPYYLKAICTVHHTYALYNKDQCCLIDVYYTDVLFAMPFVEYRRRLERVIKVTALTHEKFFLLRPCFVFLGSYLPAPFLCYC